MKSLFRLSVIVWLAASTVSCGNGEHGAADQSARVLHRGNGADPGSLDPALAEDVHAFNVLIDIYEGLIVENAAGELVPGVAKSWQVNDSGDRYVFELRSDARWSNGDPVSAHDFVRSLQRVVAPQTASSYAFLLEPILNFSAVNAGDKPLGDFGVRVLAADRLEFQLSAPASHFLSILALPISFPTHRSGDLTIGNGAYTLVDRTPGGSIHLKKNPLYRAASSVQIDEVDYFPIVDELAEFNMFRAGEIDITASVPTELIHQAIADFGAQTRISPSLALYYIALDLTEEPFNNKALRRALSLAIDRDQLVSILGRGEQAAYGVVPPGVAGYANITVDWQELSKNERERLARERYAQANFGPDKPLSFKLLYDAGGIHERVALAVSGMWRKVLGVDVTLEKREWKYFLDTRSRRNEWDAMRFAWSGDYNSPKTFLDIFRSGDEQNLSAYSSQRFDQLLQSAALEADSRANANIMRAAEKELVDDQPVIPLYFFVSKHMVSPTIKGFETNAVDRHPSRFLSFAQPE